MARWFDNVHPGLRQFWHPVAAVRDLVGAGPHPIRLIGDHYALARLETGWALLPAACPHRLAPLTAGTVDGNCIRCAYHGWGFDADGRCIDIPAIGPDATIPPTAHLQSAAGIAERYGLVWVSLDEPLTAIPADPEWDMDGFGRADMPTQTWRASAAQMADNFLDVAHFPFTHMGTIGDPDDTVVDAYEVERDGWSFSSVHRHSSKILTDAASGTSDFETFERTMAFRCDAPHHVRLQIEYGAAGVLVLMFFHQPVDAETTKLFSLILAENIANGQMTAQQHLEFQSEVGREDRELLEQLVVKAVPIDPGIETHTRADRSTVELRRILADIAALTEEIM